MIQNSTHGLDKRHGENLVDSSKRTVFDVRQTHVGAIATKKFPPTEAQLELIRNLNAKLTDAGVRTSYIKDPEDKYTASLVISSLLALCKKHGIKKEA